MLWVCDTNLLHLLKMALENCGPQEDTRLSLKLHAARILTNLSLDCGTSNHIAKHGFHQSIRKVMNDLFGNEQQNRLSEVKLELMACLLFFATNLMADVEIAETMLQQNFHEEI